MLDEIIKNIIEETVAATIQKMVVVNISKSQMPEVMNVKQLAEYLGMSVPWVYQHSKELPHENFSRKIVFNKSEIDSWVEEHRTEKENDVKLKAATIKNKIYKVI